jgi:hypothetical protein
MSSQPENPQDEVFFPVPVAGTESLTTLETKLRNDLAQGGDFDGDMIEGFRLFILARMYQGRTQSQIDDELIAWGLETNFAIELVSSTLRAVRAGDVEVTEELRVNGQLAGSWTNPHAAEKRNARRSARLRARARQLAGLEAENAPADLGFQPQQLPPKSRRRPWRKILLAMFLVLLVFAVCGGLVGLIGLP